jgi:hypothetical protein
MAKWWAFRPATQRGQSSKYVNSPWKQESSIKGKILYNYHNAKNTAHHDNYVYVLEGFMDVMALEKAAFLRRWPHGHLSPTSKSLYCEN